MVLKSGMVTLCLTTVLYYLSPFLAWIYFFSLWLSRHALTLQELLQQLWMLIEFQLRKLFAQLHVFWSKIRTAFLISGDFFNTAALSFISAILLLHQKNVLTFEFVNTEMPTMIIRWGCAFMSSIHLVTIQLLNLLRLI